MSVHGYNGTGAVGDGVLMKKSCCSTWDKISASVTYSCYAKLCSGTLSHTLQHPPNCLDPFTFHLDLNCCWWWRWWCLRESLCVCVCVCGSMHVLMRVSVRVTRLQHIGRWCLCIGMLISEPQNLGSIQWLQKHAHTHTHRTVAGNLFWGAP